MTVNLVMRTLLSNILVPLFRYLPAGTTIKDIQREFIKSLDTNPPSNEIVPSDSWLYEFVGAN